jgi:outer membrane protein insertion porin family
MTYTLKYFILFFLMMTGVMSQQLEAQIRVDYKNPKDYEIGGITVTGNDFIDPSVVILVSSLSVGRKITVPGDDISKAINNLWKQGLYGKVDIYATSVQGNFIFLNIDVEEKPRISKYAIKGVSKSEASNLDDKLKISTNDVLTDNLLMGASGIIKNHFIDKGFLNVTVTPHFFPDTAKSGSRILEFHVDKKKKIKVNPIEIEGNEFFTDAKIKRKLKNTREKKIWRVWKASKFIESDFRSDKNMLIEAYNEEGFRDARIIMDSIYDVDEKHLGIKIILDEGNRFYLRNVQWVGNTKYTDDELNEVFRVEKGDVYNQKVIDTYMYASPDGRDVHSLYMDDGYLFFSARPVETIAGNDSIDLNVIIYEGEQAYINRITVSGNTRTNDRVIMREIRTKPGQLFSRADLIRTQRELTQLKYFNQETLTFDVKPNPADGTVDIEYIVEETSTDQLELSGGWGLGRIVGTLGVSFNNFSIQDFFKFSEWKPVPSGNGQTLGVRVQSNGTYFQAYNLSFTEPWLGGKKPNAFSFGVYHSVQTNGVSRKDDGKVSDFGVVQTRQHIKISGVSLGLGRRLKWPDDFFIFYGGASYQYYDVKDYFTSFAFSSGYSNNISGTLSISRNSIDAPIYPRTGSEVSLSSQFTPPYSIVGKMFGSNKDWTEATDQDRFLWLEYHKWKMNTSFFTRLAGNLVLNTRTRFGFLGLYNRDLGLSPFERFYLGGDGLSGFSLDGRELIGMRGYSNNALTPKNAQGYYIGGTIFSKYTLEMRYPLSLNPMATIYMLTFIEAGNSWLGFNEFNPFDIKRSAGVGVRLYMPFFGILGLDWGYGFDEIPGNPGANKGQFHFSINQSID